METLPTFTEQKTWICERFGLNGQSSPAKVVASYDYMDESNNLLFQVVRYDPKDFRQRRPDGNEGWIWGLGDTPRVLYRLPDVIKAQTILVLEGEKDVLTAYRLGLPEGWAATCNPMGAEKWRAEYSEFLRGKKVVIAPDQDEAGQRHAAQVAQALTGVADEVRCLSLSFGKDLSEWAEVGGTAQEFHALLDNIPDFCSSVAYRNTAPTEKPLDSPEEVQVNLGQEIPFMSYKEETLHERAFSPKSAPEFIAEAQEEDMEWIHDDYLPAGGLVLLVAKPKIGKSTLAYQIAKHVAHGQTFLGRETRQGGVLIIAPEEHPRHIRIRLQDLGCDHTPNLFILCGPVDPTPTFFQALKAFIAANGITLVIIDTLATFWNISDENDPVAMGKAVKPLLKLARESGACVLLIHHARKSEGTYGDEIRGSGALFALADVALVMKPHEVETQRRLCALSRFPDTPRELVIELREGGYVALGDPATLDKKARKEKVKAALSEVPEEAEQIIKRAGVNNRDGRRLLALLVKNNEVQQTGEGKKGNPYRYQQFPFMHPPSLIGHETETETTEMEDSLSCTPPSPCMKEKMEEVVIDAD